MMVTGALAVLVALGTWQMARRAEKHALIDHVAARLQAPPVALPERVADPAGFDYRRVSVRGRFLHDKEILLSSRARRGVAGYHVVTPLRRDGALPVLVDRGWVPSEFAAPARRAAGQVAGVVSVTGIARVPARRGLFTPANDPARGFWLIADPAAMALAAGVGPVPGLIVEADATPSPGGYPKGTKATVNITDNHLQYALTWYSLALVLVVVVYAVRRRRKQMSRTPPTP
jgi:surfeit locus 1 family protein